MYAVRHPWMVKQRHGRKRLRAAASAAPEYLGRDGAPNVERSGSEEAEAVFGLLQVLFIRLVARFRLFVPTLADIRMGHVESADGAEKKDQNH